MNGALRELQVLAIDCQAGGATPAHGDLIELGWAACGASDKPTVVQSRWITPRSERRIPRAIRELTGWSEACLQDAWPEQAAWSELSAEIARLSAPGEGAAVATVIHYARFELPFLRDLHARLGQGSSFPFDVICVHAIAARLFPDLPRRNIRALAGFLGHSPELMRRSAGHVEATVFIWRALLPRLEAAGVTTWSQLKAWLELPVVQTRRTARRFPLPAERRRALPNRPGVYRMLRSNGDVLYVGKATSLKARIAGHFKSRGPATERGLELLSQVHEIDATETASLLEAALLETDEIKRLDPPYNVQLRGAEHRAWFATRDFRDVQPNADALHDVGPLPSQRALMPLRALIELASGAAASLQLQAMALAVPTAALPDAELFTAGWQSFTAERLAVCARYSAARRVLAASRALWLERGRAEPEAAEEAAPTLWDHARVRRRLERALVQGGLLVRRAAFLSLLADASVVFQERDMDRARGLWLARGDVVEWADLEGVAAIHALHARKPASRRERQCAFDAGAYDRLRVLLTELRRIQLEGGEVALRIGAHVFVPARLLELMRPL